MKFSLADQPDGYHISGYDDRGVRINGRSYAGSLILLPDRIVSPWRPASLAQLRDADFAELAALQPDLVLLGTGPVHGFPAPGLYASLLQAGIGVEVMDTPAACRTYNILLGEGRRVAAALLAG